MRFTAVCVGLLVASTLAADVNVDPVKPIEPEVPVDPVIPEPPVTNETEPVTPVAPKKNQTAVTIEVLSGFFTGFVGTDMGDFQDCGNQLILISNSFQDLAIGFVSGEIKLNIEGLDHIFNFMHLVKRSKKHCEAVNTGLHQMMKTMHISLSPLKFVEQIVLNSVFHIVDILSQTAYAVEDALDGGYYEAGVAAGTAWSMFLFGEQNATD